MKFKQRKVIVLSPEGDKVYTHKGFKAIHNVKYAEIRLFGQMGDARQKMYQSFGDTERFRYKHVEVTIADKDEGDNNA